MHVVLAWRALEDGVDQVHSAHMTNRRDKAGSAYDPVKAIARWETDGGAPHEGRSSKRPSVGSEPVGVRANEQAPTKKAKAKRLKRSFGFNE